MMFELSLRWVQQLFAKPDYFARIHTGRGSIQAELLSHDDEPQRSRFHFGFVSPWLTQVERVEVFCGKRLLVSHAFEDCLWLAPGVEFQYSHTRGQSGGGQFMVHHIRGQRRVSLN